MRRTVLTFIIAISVGLKFTMAQNSSQKKSFIICIDGRIASGAISRFKLIDSLDDGVKKSINVNYSPGSFDVSESDYSILKSKKTKSIILSFNYTEYCNGQSDYHYDIDFKIGWLDDYFFVLYIYNTDKNRFRKIYSPIKGKHYTYEFDYPGGSMRRAKKIRNTDCD
jgi:hypothetical protein